MKRVSALEGVCVLVVDADYRHGLSIVRSLGARGCIVDVVLSNRRSPAGLSRYVRHVFERPCQTATAVQLAAQIGDILASGHYDVAISSGTAGFQALSWGREALSKEARIPVSDYDTLALAEDKARTTRFAEQAGLDVPRTFYPLGPASLEDLPADLGFPLVVKAAGGQGHVLYACDTEELRSAYLAVCEQVPAQIAQERWPLVQEYVPGRSHGFFALMHEGRVLAHFMHERVRTVPPDGGASAVARTYFDPALLEAGSRLLGALRWHGVAMAEFRRDARDGRYRLVEVNPRFWGSLALAVRAGVDFPALLVQMALGKEVRPSEYWYSPIAFQWLSMDIAHSFAVHRPWQWLDAVFHGVPNDMQIGDAMPNLSLIAGGLLETLSGKRKLWRPAAPQQGQAQAFVTTR